MDAGSVGAAGDRGLQRRLGRGDGDDHLSYRFFSVGGVRAFFHCHGRHFTMHGDCAGNRKLQLDGDLEGERWDDQCEWDADSA